MPLWLFWFLFFCAFIYTGGKTHPFGAWLTIIFGSIALFSFGALCGMTFQSCLY